MFLEILVMDFTRTHYELPNQPIAMADKLRLFVNLLQGRFIWSLYTIWKHFGFCQNGSTKKQGWHSIKICIWVHHQNILKHFTQCFFLFWWLRDLLEIPIANSNRHLNEWNFKEKKKRRDQKGTRTQSVL